VFNLSLKKAPLRKHCASGARRAAFNFKKLSSSARKNVVPAECTTSE
jgi:hypothetical protein